MTNLREVWIRPSTRVIPAKAGIHDSNQNGCLLGGSLSWGGHNASHERTPTAWAVPREHTSTHLSCPHASSGHPLWQQPLPVAWIAGMTAKPGNVLTDLIHVAAMLENGISYMLSTDKHFDQLDEVRRIDPCDLPQR